MKRSEMINKINDYLADNTDWVDGHLSLDAEMLLNRIEEIGMIPPLEPDRRIEDCDLGLPEWKPEDE